ncbi:hypothetical protein MUP95_07830 [bacterium]|nr:hypothetical protein [bacterium]
MGMASGQGGHDRGIDRQFSDGYQFYYLCIDALRRYEMVMYRFHKIYLISILCAGFCLHDPTFSQNPAMDFERAKMAMQAGDYLQARQLLRPFLMDTTIENGEQIQAYFTTFLERGEYDEGLAEAESVLFQLPDSPYLLHMIGRFLVEKGNYREALNHFGEAFELKNDFPRNLLEIGDLFKLTGQTNQAYRFYGQITTLYQNNRLRTAEALGIAAKSYAEFEDFYRANEVFRTAYQLDPKNVQNLFWWASLFLEKYNNADAQRSHEAAVAQGNSYRVIHSINSTRSFYIRHFLV